MYVRNIVDEMIRRKADVSVISFVSHHEGVERKEYNGITLYEVGNGRDVELERLIAEVRPQVIHAHSRKAEVCEAGRRLGIPVVVTAHHGGIVCPAGTLLDCDDNICYRQVTHRNCLRCCLRNTRTGLYWYPLMRLLPEKAYIRLGRYLSTKPFILLVTPIGSTARSIAQKREEWRRIAELCTLMIAPSEVMGEAMTSRGLDKAKLRVVPHGIPLPPQVAPMPSVDGTLKFFYVGRICYVKGIHVLLEAFSGLAEKNVEMHLIGGSGNKGEERYMQGLKRRYAADPRIVWHGKVQPTEVYATIKDFHVSSSSSSYLESFGLNISESLAMGKPVLATRCGGAEMQIREGVNGWLVSTNNVEAMRAKMEEIILNKYALAGMAENCRRSVVSLQDHCEELMNIYREIR